jgi:hypothetical protein
MQLLTPIHVRQSLQLVIGLALGLMLGFLLQKGGVTDYDVIVGQLLLVDFTVVKIGLSAVGTGMIGIYALRHLGLVRLHPKPGSVGGTVLGSLIFGVGFGLLGYCPGTISGAMGQGALDAMVGGIAGVLFGAGIFANYYESLRSTILNKGYFGQMTIPELFGVSPWRLIVPLALLIAAFLFILDSFGL